MKVRECIIIESLMINTQLDIYIYEYDVKSGYYTKLSNKHAV